MSIYLEFPTIAEYPLYTDPFRNDDQLFFPDQDEAKEVKEENVTLQDYLTLRMV